MKNIYRNVLFVFTLCVVIFGITPAQNLTKNQNWSADQLEVKERIEQFLSVAGNYNLDVFKEMISDKASIGIVRLKDGERVASVITIGKYIEGVKERKIRPYFEPVREYAIHVTD